MATLPSLVCLKSANNNKYLRYRYEDVQTHGLLQFAAENMKDPYAQFEVENSKKWPGLIHIKCRYNNKYLVRWSPNHYWISASANEPNEDQTTWACTLFRPFAADNSGKSFRFVHVQLGHYVRLVPRAASDPFNLCLFAESNQADGQSKLDVITVVDWESLFTLPKRVAFLGDNGQYLGAVAFGGQSGLQFSFKDAKDPKVAHQLFSTADGTFYVKSEYYKKFWRVGNDDWVVVDAEDPRGTNNAEAMFRLTALDVNVVALLNMKPTTYVKRYTTTGRESSLATKTSSVDQYARLKLVDLGN